MKCEQVLLVNALLFKETIKAQFSSGFFCSSAQNKCCDDSKRWWTMRSKKCIFIPIDI